jgi:hypothetical protein
MFRLMIIYIPANCAAPTSQVVGYNTEAMAEEIVAQLAKNRYATVLRLYVPASSPPEITGLI